MKEFDGYVGVFDSGVGGISVLAEAMRALPHESFAYFGDSANAPYGEKSTEAVRARSEQIVDYLVSSGVKAVLIACNTATAAAAEHVRAAYPHLPIIGVEPALKPAAVSPASDRILVMATPMTLRLEKFHRLSSEWSDCAEVSTVACEGLAARIERGDLDAPDLKELLERLVGPYRGRVSSVVLGCTHYPFIRRQISEVLGDVTLFDGGAGTARHLAHQLQERGIAAESTEPGLVELRTSSTRPGELDLYRRFLDAALAGC
ncbi:glutamate racemase [Eggerthellaceae bacterium zg-997]|nr:glutamate racemase [Eggerthellaceae bacterium zg-997]